VFNLTIPSNFCGFPSRYSGSISHEAVEFLSYTLFFGKEYHDETDTRTTIYVYQITLSEDKNKRAVLWCPSQKKNVEKEGLVDLGSCDGACSGASSSLGNLKRPRHSKVDAGGRRHEETAATRQEEKRASHGVFFYSSATSSGENGWICCDSRLHPDNPILLWLK